LNAVTVFLTRSNAHDGGVVVRVLPVEIESQTPRRPRPECEQGCVFVDDHPVFVSSGEVNDLMKHLVARSESDAASKMLRRIPDEIDLVPLPTLVE